MTDYVPQIEKRQRKLQPLTRLQIDDSTDQASLSTQPKPDRREQTKTRFLQLLPDNKSHIEEIARNLQVPQYEVVRYFLTYSLAQYQRGVLSLKTSLESTQPTLFPNEPTHIRWKASRQFENTSVRGVPDGIWGQTKSIADEELEVPLWQVLNRLLEFAIKSYLADEIAITPKASGNYTLYP